MAIARLHLLRWGAAIPALLACSAVSPAVAQTAQPGARTTDLEEVMVTARRREENIQDVPAAVSAFSGAVLERQQIRQASDVQVITPNLSIGGANSVFSRNMSNYSIRGIGQGLFGGASVTSYFAEAPFGPTGPAMPFFDIQSVQILKGPQGTLFGRATAGGAVLIQPRVATADEFYGSAQGRLGNRDRADLDLMVNVPLVEDRLAVRLAFNRTKIDGYVDNLSTGQELDGNDSWSLRGSVVFRPTDRFSNTLIYNYYDLDATIAARVVIGANLGLANLNRTASSFAGVCATAVGFAPGAFGAGVDNSSVAACQAQRVGILANIRTALSAEVARTSAGGDALRTMTSGSAYANREKLQRKDLVNTTELTLPEMGPLALNLKNIFSYQRARSTVNGNFSGTPFDLNASAFGVASQSQFVNGRAVGHPGNYTPLTTNEIQVNGSLYDDAVIFIAGYYYQNTDVTDGLRGSTNLNRTFGGVATPNLGPISATLLPVDGHNRETAYFGQFTANLSRIGLHNLNFTAGYRKTKTDIVNISRAPVITYPAGTIAPGAEVRSATKGSGPGYTFSLDWQATPDLLVYATRRRGYKPGGVNVIPGASAVPGFVPEFEPESVIDTELGAKWDFRIADQARGRLNIAAFRDDYTNIQRGVNAITPDSRNIAFTANVAEARIQGFEAEGFLLIGDSWTVSGSYSFINADYTKWSGADPLGAAPAGTNIDLSNNPFANAPRNKASVTVQYQVPLAEDRGTVSALLTVYGQGRSWLSDNAQRFIEVYTGNPNVILGGRTLKEAVSDKGFIAANARLDWAGVWGMENVDLALYVRNLTDELYAPSGAVSLQSLGIVQKLYAEPRTYGLELTYRFGAR